MQILVNIESIGSKVKMEDGGMPEVERLTNLSRVLAGVGLDRRCRSRS